ncbi:Lipocalin-like domain-containing protein [Cribrihabitans marinus]|uniref:Lipocalin-like domain-containing protein n=1 Tax=Cribrihabitans marinus TaxID=1227549 RepID=A0A1H6XT64_9RHOB|nr:lipocalin-like domain-containing protein [Cribrihabitans marinus]GGH27331.1 hypothetical protein GCM10010973_15590 [Cribrihabitans marinus]SEJ28082.1 Lipocalin-like domain-containing protein [Cribrihabitans marinus]
MAEPRDLIGSWRMRSWTREAVATGVVSDAMGPNPVGYIAYHADGRMMATVFRAERPPANGGPLTEADKARLFDTMLAYVARYSIQGDQVIHHVERAWNPNWEADLSRPFTLVGRHLSIRGAPGVDPATGEEVIYRMEFEKV